MHSGRAVPRDDGRDGGDDPHQQEVAPGFIAIAKKADDKGGHQPRRQREILLPANEEEQKGRDCEPKITIVFVVHVLLQWLDD